MAEPGRIGNDEPGNLMPDESPDARERRRQKRQEKLTVLVQPIADSAHIGRMRALPWIFAVAVLVAIIGAPDAADARGVRRGAYDGTWNVMFVTRAGNCSSTNSVPFAVSGRRVSSAGGGRVTGGVSPAGVVSVRISVGRSVASGSGRLVGSSGAGRWSGIILGDRCSGIWRATRG